MYLRKIEREEKFVGQPSPATGLIKKQSNKPTKGDDGQIPTSV
jgi:hypothetical protein